MTTFILVGTNKMITIFGSCRQHSLRDHHNVTNIQEELTYPHYSKEILQAIRFCKGQKFTPEETKFCFRTGILNNTPLKSTDDIQRQFSQTELFVVEIASRLAYEYNGRFVHHILKEDRFGFDNRALIQTRTIEDDELRADILEIQRELYPKPWIIVGHIYTRMSGSRYNLVRSLESIASSLSIPFIDPSRVLSNYKHSDVYNLEEDTLSHYTPTGNTLIGKEYKRVIQMILDNKERNSS